jgi:hypothetical protein
MATAARGLRRHWRAATLVAWAVLAGLVTSRHEMWRDEWLYWDAARHASSLSELRAGIRDFGHPHLWPALLWLVSRVSAGPALVQAVHLAVAAAVVALVLWRAPFSAVPRVLLCFGYYPFYEYAVISRNYGLGLLAVAALCALARASPWRYAALGLGLVVLVLSNPYAALLAGALFLGLAVEWRRRPEERRRWRAALGAAALALVGAAAAASQMAPTAGSLYDPDWRTHLDARHAAQALAAVWRGLVPLPWPGPHFWNSNLLQGARAAEAVLGLGLLAGGAWLFRRHAPALVTWLAGSGALLVFFYAYNPYPDTVAFSRHCGHFFVALLAASWLQGHASRLLALLLAVHVGAAAYAAGMDVALPFSGSEEAAAIIREAGWDRMPVVADIDHATVPVASRLERAFYFPSVRAEGRPVPRRHVTRRVLRQEVARLQALTPGPVLLLLTYPLGDPAPFTPVAVVDRSIVANERYWLYAAR